MSNPMLEFLPEAVPPASVPTPRPYAGAAPHDPATIATALAELVGQFQHFLDLQEVLIGRNVYDPIVVDLSKGTSQTVTLPAEAHQIETVQVSGDTAATIQFYRVDQYSGPSGKLVGQVYLPANNVAPPLALNCAVPPTSCTLIIKTSAAITNGSCVIVLARTRNGGYPYAG